MSSASGSSNPQLTLFAIPKPFRGHIGVIQRNAITAWTRIHPRPNVILFGNDEGTGEIARELGLLHFPNVQCNRWETPLVSDLFAKAEQLSQTPLLSYVNADIILFDDFPQALARVAASQNRFLMVGRRTDVDITQSIAFDQSDWAGKIRQQAQTSGVLQIARSIDYFAFARGLYPPMPPLAVGRFWWDNWLIWKARSLGATVVDASTVVTIVHQNHDYSHTAYGSGKHTLITSEEAQLNCRLACEQNPSDFAQGLSWRYVYTIDDATHRLTPQGIAGNPGRHWKNFERNASHPAGVALLVRAAFEAAKRRKRAAHGASRG
jgi:hypothetical protein